MVNLNVSIVVRTTESKRSWVKADGKTDPQGTYYLRHCVGSIPRYTKAGGNFHEAEIAHLRLERKLKAASQGFTVPEEAPVPTSHRCDIALTAYLAYLRVAIVGLVKNHIEVILNSSNEAKHSVCLLSRQQQKGTSTQNNFPFVGLSSSENRMRISYWT